VTEVADAVMRQEPSSVPAKPETGWAVRSSRGLLGVLGACYRRQLVAHQTMAASWVAVPVVAAPLDWKQRYEKSDLGEAVLEPKAAAVAGWVVAALAAASGVALEWD